MVPDAGMTSHSQGAWGVTIAYLSITRHWVTQTVCVTHRVPAQKPTVFLGRQGTYPVQKASNSRRFFNLHTFIQQIVTEDLLNATHSTQTFRTKIWLRRGPRRETDGVQCRTVLSWSLQNTTRCKNSRFSLSKKKKKKNALNTQK